MGVGKTIHFTQVDQSEVIPIMDLPATTEQNPSDSGALTVPKTLPKLTGKRRRWLFHFLNLECDETFFNGTQSAKRAKYNAKSYAAFGQIGHENYKKLEAYINQWLDEYGLSESRLKLKVAQLTGAKRTILQKVKGHISEDLPDNVTKIAETHIQAWKGQGEGAEAFDDGETVLGITVEDPECQRRALDMALKVKGLYNKNEGSTIRPIFNINFFPGDPTGPATGPIINIEPQDPEAKKAKD